MDNDRSLHSYNFLFYDKYKTDFTITQLGPWLVNFRLEQAYFPLSFIPDLPNLWVEEWYFMEQHSHHKIPQWNTIYKVDPLLLLYPHTKIYHFDSKINKFNCLGWIWEKGLLFQNTIFRLNSILLCQISLFYTITFPVLIYRISNDTSTPCSYIFEIFCLIFYFTFSMLFLVASLFFFLSLIKGYFHNYLDIVYLEKSNSFPFWHIWLPTHYLIRLLAQDRLLWNKVSFFHFLKKFTLFRGYS